MLVFVVSLIVTLVVGLIISIIAVHRCKDGFYYEDVFYETPKSIIVSIIMFCAFIIGFVLGLFLDAVVSTNYYNDIDHYTEPEVLTYELIPYSVDDTYYLYFSKSKYQLQYEDENGITESLSIGSDEIDISYGDTSKPTIVIKSRYPEESIWFTTKFGDVQDVLTEYSVTIPSKESIYYGVGGFVPK